MGFKLGSPDEWYHYNYLSNNKVKNNTLGIDIYGDYFMVTDNLVIDNDMSIKMRGNSTAYLNTFVNNGI